ncbi:hypothetical protein VKT23_010087 [Stygiomarasmius scandens]|uniref:Uncharacterized protein n=1 Tax=Marasmiellus scandens TaxID=2682957 RepID=A0ABR1JDM7_9AGAR
MSPWVSEFSEALHQAATALRILSDIYDQKNPMNLRTFDISSMENTTFTQALLTASTTLYSLSTTFNADRFPGESVEQEWHYVETNMQPPPLDPPVPPTRPSTPTLPLTPTLPTTPLPAAPTCPSAQTYGCIYRSKLL